MADTTKSITSPTIPSSNIAITILFFASSKGDSVTIFLTIFSTSTFWSGPLSFVASTISIAIFTISVIVFEETSIFLSFNVD